MKLKNYIIYILFTAIFLPCCESNINSINSDEDIIKLRENYKKLDDAEKTKLVNELINYYQFSESDEALLFLRDKVDSNDQIVVHAVTVARDFKIDIPLHDK